MLNYWKSALEGLLFIWLWSQMKGHHTFPFSNFMETMHATICKGFVHVHRGGVLVAISVEWVFEESCIIWVSSARTSPLKLSLSLAPFFFMPSLTLLCTCCSRVICMDSLKTKSRKHGMSHFVHIHLCVQHFSLSSYVDVPTLEVKVVI
jgi:hypothetical protein